MAATEVETPPHLMPNGTMPSPPLAHLAQPAAGKPPAQFQAPAAGEASTLALAEGHYRARRLDDAERLCQQRLLERPNDLEALHLLGRIAFAFARFKVAAVLLGKAAAGRPDVAVYQRRYAEALHATGQLSQAIAAMRRAAELDPGDARTFVAMGRCQLEMGDAPAALASARRAVALDPHHARAYHVRGMAELTLAQVKRAVISFRRAVALNPDLHDAHAAILFALHYLPLERAAVVEESLRWARRHAAPVAHGARPHANTPDPTRRLKVGYVSADLHTHPVGYFLEAVLKSHDRSAVEVYCYSNNRRADATTERLRAASDHWRVIWGMADTAAEEMIRTDGIDVLVDVSGHTGDNRLLLFARKPAPVQASWLGYFDTTGMQEMDYLLADRVVCPPGDDGYYTERVVRLPGPYLCFTPPAVDVAVAPPPSLSAPNTSVTFGCFNNVAKVTPQVAALWSRLLHALPDARLILKSEALGHPSVRRRFRAMFTRHGIAASRVIIEGRSSRPEYLATYGRIDVALDPFPYTGGTTTAEALWMGVPVVTLRGDRFVSRMCETYLRAVGLDALVAATPDEYVRTAASLATDPSRLAGLRSTLRGRMERSPLCDGPAFTRGLDAAYRSMWQEWCVGASRTP